LATKENRMTIYVDYYVDIVIAALPTPLEQAWILNRTKKDGIRYSDYRIDQKICLPNIRADTMFIIDLSATNIRGCFMYIFIVIQSSNTISIYTITLSIESTITFYTSGM